MSDKITGDNLFRMIPGLKEAMSSALEKCGIPHADQIQENTSINMSPYKDSIKNAETPKSKQAKNKVDELFRK
jgi:hypothetical protein